MSLPPSFIQELLARTDVVEVVGHHVQLKKSGANYKGLCPFHTEKTPSFSVNPTKQFFYCFGCGKSGNAVHFLMEFRGLGYIEAVTELARDCGLKVPEDNPQHQAVQQRIMTLMQVLERACAAYQNKLQESERAKAYLKGRGLNSNVVRQYGLGYAPPGWNMLAGVFPRYDDPLLVECGLVIENTEHPERTKRYDRFRDRVIFPIRNFKGECIGFGGRVLGDDKPKYLNSPETAVFNKGRELYGLFEGQAEIRRHGYALVTEGYMDVVALAQLGFPNVVATLGTACTAEHLHKLFRCTDAVVFSFDGDTAGRNAARKALEVVLPLVTDVRSIKFLFLPPEHDPDSYIRAFGQDAFSRYVTEALPLSRFLLDVASEGCDLHWPEGRSRMASQAQLLWERIPECVLKHQLLGEIGALAQSTKQELLSVWQSHGKARRSGTTETRRPYSRRTHFQDNPRANHAVRLLLDQMDAMASLTEEDLSLLSALPAPYGPLLAWLESQYHEHGAQPWVVLQEGLRQHEFSAFAHALMDTIEIASDTQETIDELRRLLNRIRIDHIKAEQTRLIQQADPESLQRYRELEDYRKKLQAHT